MNKTSLFGYVALMICLFECVPLLSERAMSLYNDKLDLAVEFGVKFKPEFYWGKNISLLNNSNEADRIIYFRHTIDLDFDAIYGKKIYDDGIAELKWTMRNRGIWGNPTTIARTTRHPVKGFGVVFGDHDHGIPRHIPWWRELWLKFDLGKATGLALKNRHSFTLGAFPFQLGRGISLGDAYAVGPEILGFYSDYIVDQFAFGGLFSGTVVRDYLNYDIYMALLQNKSSSLGETAEVVNAQEFGKFRCPQRGFGKINYVIAGRLMWTVFNTKELGKLNLEPYALFNADPEQRVEFIADATAKLGTIGMAGEYYGDLTEFGFDFGFNVGEQSVKGWDRNHIEPKNVNAFVQVINTHVIQNGSSTNIPFVSQTFPAQVIIETSEQNQSQNGKIIGTVPDSFGGLPPGPVVLQNKNNRFRNPYTNTFQGWMFVADAARWVYNKDLLFTVTAGIASGGHLPHDATQDTVYNGFIGLQEIYSGKRVKSAFLLGGSGKLKRPFSAPTTNQSPFGDFAVSTSGFTNLVFTGAGLNWKPRNKAREFGINPNALFYWQEKATRKFDLDTLMDSPHLARTFLGAELNTFAYVFLMKNLKGFAVLSCFIPGSHYSDIRGKPLNRDQARALRDVDRSADTDAPLPNIGTDVAIAINFGLEYFF